MPAPIWQVPPTINSKKMEKGAEAGRRRRRRNPLSDCTNSSINKPTLSSSSSSSFALNKSSVTKCSNSRFSLPPPGTVDLRDVSELISVCGSRLRTSYERKKNKRKAVPNPVVACSKPLPEISNIRKEKSDGVEGLDLSEAKQSCRKKQHAVYKHKSKGAQLQEFIEKQTAYFKEVDEFKLSEEEVGSIDELE